MGKTLTPKEKIVTIYNAFLENKKHAINVEIDEYDFNSASRINTGYIQDQSIYYSSTSDVKYFVGNPIKQILIHENGFKEHRFSFGEVTKIPKGHIRAVKLVLSVMPDILLEEKTKTITVMEKEHKDVQYTSRWDRFKYDPLTINEVRYELRTTRILTFGSIKFDLSEEEFYTLFDKAIFHNECRQQEIDEVKLDDRIKEYCKKDTK